MSELLTATGFVFWLLVGLFSWVLIGAYLLQKFDTNERMFLRLRRTWFPDGNVFIAVAAWPITLTAVLLTRGPQ